MFKGYVSENVITKALDFVKEISPIPDVYPTARNSIQFEWETGERYVEIEVFEDKIELYYE